MSTHQSKAATTDSKKRRRWPKVLLGVLGGLLAIVAIAWVVAANRPGLVVNAIQSAFHKDGTQANSYEPLDQAADGQDENGVYVRANIAYADEYPNSYLDIRYASDPAAVDSATHPTMVYIHGGGWFYGSKTKGDPMSVESSNYMMDSIVKDGYNLVSMDYALRPDYGFPVPMEQLDQCVRFLQEHAAEYGLDMTNVYFFGQSAGAVMTTQYATLVTGDSLQMVLARNWGQLQVLFEDDSIESVHFVHPLTIADYLATTPVTTQTAFGFQVLPPNTRSIFAVSEAVSGS